MYNKHEQHSPLAHYSTLYFLNILSPLSLQLRLARIDVLCWGLRRLSKYKRTAVNNPHVAIECGGFRTSSPRMLNLSAMPNFVGRKPPKSKKAKGSAKDGAAVETEAEKKEKEAEKEAEKREKEDKAKGLLDPCVLSFEVHLPLEVEFSPPLLICVYDNRKFGRKPLVGTHRIAAPQDYLFSGQWKDPDEQPPPRYEVIDAQQEAREAAAKKEAEEIKAAEDKLQAESPKKRKQVRK